MEVTRSRRPDLHLFALIVLYSLAYGLLLVNRGFFWDDWCWVLTRPEVALEASRELGLPLVGWLATGLSGFGLWGLPFRAVTFGSFLVAGMCLYDILKKSSLPQSDRFFIVFLFLLAPLNPARIAACTLHYAICYGSFFLGWWCLCKFLLSRGYLWRALSLIFFGFSFQTNSLLVFYALPFAYLVTDRFKCRAVAERWTRFADFLFLPVLFFVVKAICFKPYGPYAGYNTVEFHPVRFCLLSISSVRVTFIDVAKSALIQVATSIPLITVPVVAILLWALCRRLNVLPSDQAGSERRNALGALIGILLICLALFPYLVVSKVARTDVVWETRHHLLLPLGYAVFLYYATAIFSARLRGVLLCLGGTIFLLANMCTWYAFERDWLKQVEMVGAIRQCPEIKESRTILFHDETRFLNAHRRDFKFYEWNALMKLAFGQESRLGVTDYEYNGMAYYEESINGHYLFSQYKRSPPDCNVRLDVINEGEYAPAVMARRLLLELRNPAAAPESFHNSVRMRATRNAPLGQATLTSGL